MDFEGASSLMVVKETPVGFEVLLGSLVGVEAVET